MLTDVLPPDTAPARRRTTTTDRVAGAGGLLFAALLLVQNVIRAQAPSFGASPESVTSYFADHRAAALVPLGLFPLGMVAILCFAAGIRARATGAEGRWWADVGSLAVVVLAGLFSIVNIIELVVAASGSSLEAAPHVVQALWTLHAAAFGLDLAAIAIALVGLSRAAHSAGLSPRWLVRLAMPGAACLFAASTGTVLIAEGGRWLYLGFVGFAVWALFLVVTGTALLRSGGPEPDPA